MSSERRLHPYSVVFAFLTQIRVFIVPGILLYFGIGSSENEWWQPWMMAFVIPAGAFSVLRYLTYRYRYEASELVIRTGLLFRKERHIPYARIQNIDAVQNLLHRVLHVVEIKIETGSGQTAEATMSVLPLRALTEMRERVFAERHAVAVATEEPTVEPHRALLHLDVRELLLCGFIENRGAVVIAALAGVIWEMGIFNRVIAPVFGEEATRGVIRNLVRGTIPNVTVSWAGIALSMVAFLGLLMAIRVFSMGWAFVRLYGFTLTLVDDDARSQFGLLTRVALTIPLRRIQSLTIREGPLHRAFARVAIKVATAGGRAGEQNTSSEREYIAPILRREALDGFVHAIIGVSVTNLAWNGPDPRAFRREIKGWLVPGVVMTTAAAFSFQWYALVLLPIVIVWAVVGARKTLEHLAWALTDDAIVFKSGWLWRRLVVVRLAKIQTVTRHESPFDRRTHMARIYVDTAGASEGSVVNVPYVPRDVASRLYEQLAREAAQRQFQW